VPEEDDVCHTEWVCGTRRRSNSEFSIFGLPAFRSRRGGKKDRVDASWLGLDSEAVKKVGKGRARVEKAIWWWRDEGAYPLWSVTEEQRRQMAFSARARRVARLLALACVARSGKTHKGYCRFARALAKVKIRCNTTLPYFFHSL